MPESLFWSFLVNFAINLCQKCNLLRRAVQVKNRFQKQSFAVFKLGVLKNFVNSTEKHLCRSLFLIKLQTSYNSSKHFNTGVFLCKISNNTFLTEEFQWLLLRFKSCFQRSSKQKPVRLSAKNTTFSWKKSISCRKNNRSGHRRCSVKEDLQGPAQVFTCEYLLMKIFKNIYFENHLWTAAPEYQHLGEKFTERR